MASNHLIPVIPFSSHLQSFPASGSFQMSQFFTSGGQSIGVSASASILPVNIQDWFPLGWTGCWRVMVESSDKMWSTGEGNGKLFQYSCLENPMNRRSNQSIQELNNLKILPYLLWCCKSCTRSRQPLTVTPSQGGVQAGEKQGQRSALLFLWSLNKTIYLISLTRRFKRYGFNPWVKKIPWRREWLPVFLPEESHGQRSLVATVHGAIAQPLSTVT